MGRKAAEAFPTPAAPARGPSMGTETNQNTKAAKHNTGYVYRNFSVISFFIGSFSGEVYKKTTKKAKETGKFTKQRLEKKTGSCFSDLSQKGNYLGLDKRKTVLKQFKQQKNLEGCR
jgi:hypothetical protein